MVYNNIRNKQNSTKKEKEKTEIKKQVMYSVVFGEYMYCFEDKFTTYTEAKKRYDELKNNEVQFASLWEEIYTKGFLKKEEHTSTKLEGYNLVQEGKW